MVNNIIEQWKKAESGIYERFMITYCPVEQLEDEVLNYRKHFEELAYIFEKSMKKGIDAEFYSEYGKTNRLHFHIVIMCRTKSAYYSYYKTIFPKLKVKGFVHRSKYHEGLPEYLSKEQTNPGTTDWVEDEVPLPRCFSTETLVNYLGTILKHFRREKKMV